MSIIRFFRKTAIASAVLACAQVMAMPDVSDLAAQADRIKASAASIVGDMDIPESSDDVLMLAEEIMRESKSVAKTAMPHIGDHFDVQVPGPEANEWAEGEWVDILVSRSLEEELVETIKALDGSKIRVRFVFRGIAEGQKINDAFADYGRWAGGLENPPGATLDPTIFRDNNVTSVPHMLFRRDNEVVASVSGLSNPQWLVDAVERGETGYLGARGPIKEVSERDLIAVMQERAAGLDMESKKEETIKTYWERASFEVLSSAPEDSRRLIDPSVVIPDGLADANGREILPPGTVINPLDLRPFTLRLVIFNPNKKEEQEWVSALEDMPHLETVFMATELDREEGWDQLETVQDTLDSAVYMLTPEVRQRFELRHTPSIVTADSRHFVVDEFKPMPGISHEN